MIDQQNISDIFHDGMYDHVMMISDGQLIMHITFNAMWSSIWRNEMMVFRPLLCTLFRLNWAKH